jgi:hypothetical protein
MLGWHDLTRNQRFCGVFLLLLFVGTSPFLVFVLPTSFGERLWYAGLMSTACGVILDPQSFRIRYGTLVTVAAMPGVCRILIGTGIALTAIGFVIRHLSYLNPR